jgi:hypothetical protein
MLGIAAWLWKTLTAQAHPAVKTLDIKAALFTDIAKT